MEFQQKNIALSLIEKQILIKKIKDTFERKLAKTLDLTRVSAPILIDPTTGLQDDLSGTERKVEFDLGQTKHLLQVVQSLAKWKRFALEKYQFEMHKGLYTDMMAIRRDDLMDETHSIYVDQWDWEKIIDRQDRTIKYLKQTVRKIAKAIVFTSQKLSKQTSKQLPTFSDKVFFITSEELLQMYPNLDSKQREYQIVKKHKTVFILQIGDYLSNGEKHDNRAPDYDDWQLNGDLMIYHEVLDIALEISSMGIRVDESSIKIQLEKAKQQQRMTLPYHKAVIEKQLPLTIGGGIGQSRLCMLLLGCRHIGEVQSSFWPEQIKQECKQKHIELL